MFTLIAVFAPLIGAVLAGVARPFIGKQLAIGASILFMVVSAVAGVASFVTYVQGGVPIAPLHIAAWISVGSFTPGWTSAAGHADPRHGRHGIGRFHAHSCLQCRLHGA